MPMLRLVARALAWVGLFLAFGGIVVLSQVARSIGLPD